MDDIDTKSVLDGWFWGSDEDGKRTVEMNLKRQYFRLSFVSSVNHGSNYGLEG